MIESDILPHCRQIEQQQAALVFTFHDEDDFLVFEKHRGIIESILLEAQHLVFSSSSEEEYIEQEGEL